jgi:hypothetical protein
MIERLLIFYLEETTARFSLSKIEELRNLLPVQGPSTEKQIREQSLRKEFTILNSQVGLVYRTAISLIL